jgi:creatinine amidohydrolase
MAMADQIELAEMTWTDVDQALKDRPVALLPVGATEAHGPHLPLSADTVIATEMARRGAAKLREHGVASLIAPPVTFTVAELGASFAGTVTIPAETSIALLRDLCVSLGRRFRAVALVNVHLEPRHIECVKSAVDAASKAGISACWIDITKKRWSETLGEAFQQGDHAGSFETSLMMVAAPEMVRERERISLPPVEGMTSAMKKGAKSFAEAGGEDAYFGDPTAASAELGEDHFDALAEILRISVMEHLGSKAG